MSLKKLAARLDPWPPPLLLMGLIFYLSSRPDLDSGLGLIDSIGRKFVHAGEYGLLWFLWWRALREVTRPLYAGLLAALISIGYAATDEWHQSFVEGRHGTHLDVLFDAVGITLAAGALALSERRRRARA